MLMQEASWGFVKLELVEDKADVQSSLGTQQSTSLIRSRKCRTLVE